MCRNWAEARTPPIKNCHGAAPHQNRFRNSCLTPETEWAVVSHAYWDAMPNGSFLYRCDGLQQQQVCPRVHHQLPTECLVTLQGILIFTHSVAESAALTNVPLKKRQSLVNVLRSKYLSYFNLRMDNNPNCYSIIIPIGYMKEKHFNH